jgi:PAS domain-containing protein
MIRGAMAVSRVGRQVPHAYLEKKFLDFLETVPDAMILSDDRGRIILVNANTERMFGHDRSYWSRKSKSWYPAGFALATARTAAPITPTPARSVWV